MRPGRRQVILWTNARIYLIGPLGTHFSEMLIDFFIFIQENAFENVDWKMVAFCLGLNVLNVYKLCTGLSGYVLYDICMGL